MNNDLTTRVLITPLQPHGASATQSRGEDTSIPDTPPDPAPEHEEPLDVVSRADGLQEMSEAQEANRRDWLNAMQDVAELLSPQRDLQELARYLHMGGSRWVTSSPACPYRERVDASALVNKLRLLQHSGLEIGLVQAALEHSLRTGVLTPAELCHAVIDSQIRLSPMPTQWDAWGARFKMAGAGAQVSGALSDANPAEAPPVRSATALPQGQERLALVSTGTEDGFEALLQRLQREQDSTRQDQMENPQDERQILLNAYTLLLDFLGTGQPLPQDLTTQEGACMAKLLLGAGEHALLRHMLSSLPVWPLRIERAEHAAVLKGLVPWPAPGPRCLLGLDTNMTDAMLGPVVEFARALPGEHLEIQIEVFGVGSEAFWSQLAQCVLSLPGVALSLAIGDHNGQPPSLVGLLGFLREICGASIRRLDLANLHTSDGALLKALSGLIRDSNIPVACPMQCSDDVTQAVLTCHPWAELEVVSTPEVVTCFQTKTVSARTLRVFMNQLGGDQRVSDILGACKDLARAEVRAGPIRLAAVAEGLEKSGSAHKVSFMPAPPADPQEASTARAALERNTAILDIELVPANPAFAGAPTAIAPELWAWTQNVLQRNRIQDSHWFGVGKGFGWSLGDGFGLGIARDSPATGVGLTPFVDPLVHLGPHLDLPSAQALSATSRAALASARELRSEDIARMSALLAWEVSFNDFAIEMEKRILCWRLSGVTPSPQERPGPHNSILFKVAGMRDAGLPDPVIAAVLQHRLQHVLTLPKTENPTPDEMIDRNSARALLEALAYVGAMPPETWLREGMGMEVQTS